MSEFHVVEHDERPDRDRPALDVIADHAERELARRRLAAQQARARVAQLQQDPEQLARFFEQMRPFAQAAWRQQAAAVRAMWLAMEPVLRVIRDAERARAKAAAAEEHRQRYHAREDLARSRAHARWDRRRRARTRRNGRGRR